MSLVKKHADWLLFVTLALVFMLFPQIDMTVSGWFYDLQSRSWPLEHHPISDSIYALFRYVPYVLVPVLLITVALTFVKGGVDKAQRKIWVFLLVSLIAGPGILVHSVFKETFDRARPRQVQEFGGQSGFTPAFVISDKCQKKCASFVSGHAAMGFWLMSLAWVFRRRSWLWAGMGIGLVVSAVRIVQGGHFLSDTLMAGFVCYFVYRGLSWWLFGHSRIRPEPV
ncbi:phosphatase PAP2 family protein [Thalassolituus sp. LLYu03]|uniref:phosphatase PAP2 family protein n=1 Tax=Thalassolituus sp. LLYu03 TaxID=3421656 RepID=UPI003D2ADC9F